MAIQVIYGIGGCDTQKPFNNVIVQYDDDTRTYTDYRSGQPISRAYTTEENTVADLRSAQEVINTNEQTLLDKATQALTKNATFLSLTNPTTAQAVKQVKALTRQVNALIKLRINDLTNITGT